MDGPSLGNDAARTAVAPPRLTRLCEFEDEQLEAKYKRNQMLEGRMAHITVVTVLLVSLGPRPRARFPAALSLEDRRASLRSHVSTYSRLRARARA
ncbi:hypothetical protein T492DRAFT_1140704 [Pavlovales sp. CCMP2436]|nr:hypothetical protein T492DRAFT_1140704 [Pavlovales sp. CCMP2436]